MGSTKTYTEVTVGGQTVTVASHGDGNASGRFLRSYECCACGHEFQEDEVVMFRGRPYGKPCGCYTDIRSIIKKEVIDRAPMRNVKEVF